MNIAVDVSTTAGFRTGTEEYIEGLVFGLHRAGVQVVGVGREGQALLPDKPGLGLKVRERPGPWSKWWWENYGVRRIPRDVDVLHIPFMGHPAKRLRIPSVVTVHDLIPYRLNSYHRHIKERAYFAHVKRALPYADRLVAISEATLSDLKEFFPGLVTKTIVIPNGVHPDFFDGIDVERSEIVVRRFGLKRHPRILYVGGYDERKNVGTLLEAVSRVFSRRPEGELVLVGAKDHLLIRRHIAELKLDGRVVTTPFVSRSELVTLYNTADLFAFPSRYEGFGMPPAQALAVGVPVIAGDTPAVREVVREYGVMVDPDSVDGWTQAITGVLESPAKAQKLVDGGRRRAQDFSWENIAKQYLNVYQQVRQERR